MGLLEAYNYYVYELADERTKDWFLSGSPMYFTLISCAYLYFIYGCGPRYMKDKQPYSLRGFIRFYNVFQIVSNAMLVYHILENGWYEDPFIYCIPHIDMSWNPKALKWAELCWYMYILKCIDYTETVIFVLRKKTGQISILHVFHHVSTVAYAFLAVKYWAHELALTIVLLNSSVHVIMYTFYFLASYGSNVQKYLRPIKPIITIMQMVQLAMIFGYGVQNIILPQCHEHIPPVVSGTVILVVDLILFYNFYRENYGLHKKKVK